MSHNRRLIIDSLKDRLGIPAEDHDYDGEVIDHINSLVSKLDELGVNHNWMVIDLSTSWDSYCPHKKLQGFIREYFYVKLKLIFDPPAAMSSVQYYKEQGEELEWRMMTMNGGA